MLRYVKLKLKKDEEKEAIKEMNGTKFEGSSLTVSKANRSREEERPKESFLLSQGKGRNDRQAGRSHST